MMCQIVKQQNFLMGEMSVRHESSLDADRVKHQQFLGDMSFLNLSSMKSVEVVFLNKLYKGVGMRNRNGGMEFFHPEFKEKQNTKIQLSLESLRKQHHDFIEERERLQEVINDGNHQLSEWVARTDMIQSQLMAFEATLRTIINQNREGLISDEEKHQRRKALLADKKKLLDEKTDLEGKIKTFKEAQERLRFLDFCIPELEEKIIDKSSEYSLTGTVTIDQPGILYFPLIKGAVSKSCCLFLDMFDYLSYIYLLNNTDHEVVPRCCDSIVMNDIRNFVPMTIQSDDYDKIYCFFPNTILGKVMVETLIDRNAHRNLGCVQNSMDDFSGYVSLYEFVKEMDNSQDGRPYIYPVFI